jgi:hypothetical protein
LIGENEDCDETNIPCNLLIVAATGNSVFLEDLLKVGMDPDISDSKGRTPLVHYPSQVVKLKQTCKLATYYILFL